MRKKDRANDLFVNKFYISFILLFTFISPCAAFQLVLPSFQWMLSSLIVFPFCVCLCIAYQRDGKHKEWNCARRLIQSMPIWFKTSWGVYWLVVKRPLGAPTTLDQFRRLILSSDANLKWRLRYDLTPFPWWLQLKYNFLSKQLNTMQIRVSVPLSVLLRLCAFSITFFLAHSAILPFTLCLSNEMKRDHLHGNFKHYWKFKFRKNLHVIAYAPYSNFKILPLFNLFHLLHMLIYWPYPFAFYLHVETIQIQFWSERTKKKEMKQYSHSPIMPGCFPREICAKAQMMRKLWIYWSRVHFFFYPSIIFEMNVNLFVSGRYKDNFFFVLVHW